MSSSSQEHDELGSLLGAVRDGLIDGEQMARLDHLLASDPEARRRYLEYIDLCVMLRHYQGTSQPRMGDAESWKAPVRTAAEPLRRPARREWNPWLGRLLWSSTAAASLLVAVLFGVQIERRGGTSVSVSVGAGPRTRTSIAESKPKPVVATNIAVLTRTIDPVWGPTKLPTEVGSALPAGRLRLKSGLIQLEFYGGAIVVLEGPADFELLAIDRASCRQGKLRVRAPLESSQFSVTTPNASVVDLGTEFGIQVDASGESEIQVFEGSVALHDKAADPPAAPGREVMMGQGVRINTSGVLRSIAVNPRSFIGERELEQRSSTEAGLRYRAWRELSQKLQMDPRVLLYYTFEGQQLWERTLRDRATGRTPRRDGSIIGSQWAEGRWPGKSALDFKRTSDRVRIKIPGEFQAMTLMAWVRVDTYDHRLNSLLLADGWGTPGEIHWELDGDGCVIFALKDGRPPGNLIVKSPVVLDYAQLGLWTHLATVFAPRNDSVTIYVNGQPVKSEAIPRQIWATIGWANIGNWSNPPPTDPADVAVRNFNGRIDEFLVFDEALEAQEIQAIYEVGKPTS
jgi:hypothetical protein